MNEKDQKILNDTQLEIVQFIASGYSTEEIAKSLKLSFYEVSQNLSTIYKSWDVRINAGVCIEAIKRGHVKVPRKMRDKSLVELAQKNEISNQLREVLFNYCDRYKTVHNTIKISNIDFTIFFEIADFDIEIWFEFQRVLHERNTKKSVNDK